jgi:omega-amidase
MMKQDLNICLVQQAIEWENPKANYSILDNIFLGVDPSTDVIVLPEMFTTGFSMEPQRIAEAMSDEMPTLQWMRKWTKQLDTCITGSVSISENGQYFNRLLWVFPEGNFLTYDKRHTFTFAGEDKVYQRGKTDQIIEWRGWRIKPLICYDLRFPIWSKNRMTADQADYDLLIYVANWPAVRRDPWNKLLPARAIENQCYLAAANRLGLDGNGLEYAGDSAILDPRGATVAEIENSNPFILSAKLDASSLLDFREKFPVLKDDDDRI